MGASTDIRDRLVAIEKLMVYDGEAVNAARYIPENIQPHQLPLFINFPIGAARAQFADTYYKITRTWNLRLWSRKEGDGLRSENEDRILDLADLTYTLFVSRPRLELDGLAATGVYSALLTGDSGMQIRPYPSNEPDHAAFYMIDFSMNITYRSRSVCT